MMQCVQVPKFKFGMALSQKSPIDVGLFCVAAKRAIFDPRVLREQAYAQAGTKIHLQIQIQIHINFKFKFSKFNVCMALSQKSPVPVGHFCVAAKRANFNARAARRSVRLKIQLQIQFQIQFQIQIQTHVKLKFKFCMLCE